MTFKAFKVNCSFKSVYRLFVNEKKAFFTVNST
jgi:hypothetical protein